MALFPTKEIESANSRLTKLPVLGELMETDINKLPNKRDRAPELYSNKLAGTRGGWGWVGGWGGVSKPSLTRFPIKEIGAANSRLTQLPGIARPLDSDARKIPNKRGRMPDVETTALPSNGGEV